MNSYPKYKSSELPTFNEVPAHWHKNRIKHIGFMYGGLTGKSGDDFRKDEDDPTNRPFIPFTNICNNTYIKRDELKLVSINENDNQNQVEKDDLFFMMTSETQEDVGKTSVLKEDLGEVYLNTFCKGFRITDKSVNPYFLNYLLNGKPYREMLSIEGNGFTRINLRQDRVNDLIVFTPPLPEQEQIVEYLDEKTSQIDGLISITEKKIELLKQKRTVLINEAVTKGLNANFEMKDSGVEWIGKIPQHWVGITLRQLYTKIGSGVTPRGGSEVYVNDGVIFVRSQNVHFDGLRLEEVVRISPEIHSNMSGTVVQKDDVLLNITGASIGRCCIVEMEEEMNVNQHVCIIRCKDRIRPKYLNLVLQSLIGQTQVDLYITGGNREGLNIDNIKNFYIPLPPTIEQLEIVGYIDTYTTEIDKLVSIEQRRIETLKEYRQSLISEVVTGKIKVN